MIANAAAVAEDAMADVAAVVEMEDALLMEEEMTDEEVMTIDPNVVMIENVVIEAIDLREVTEEIENLHDQKEAQIEVQTEVLDHLTILEVQETVLFLEKEDVEASFMLFFF